MFWVLLFIDMRNIIHGHVSVWWYIIALTEDVSVVGLAGSSKGR